MPADALPVPHPQSLAGTVNYRRSYLDTLGRPMRGDVTLTGSARSASGDAVVVPAPVAVPLVDGVLDVNLPPDVYRVVANLRTADGARVTDSDTVTLTESE